jgi:hypothetical protein
VQKRNKKHRFIFLSFLEIVFLDLLLLPAELLAGEARQLFPYRCVHGFPYGGTRFVSVILLWPLIPCGKHAPADSMLRSPFPGGHLRLLSSDVLCSEHCMEYFCAVCTSMIFSVIFLRIEGPRKRLT